MPIYEYRCRRCGEIFERYMKTNEKADSLICPYCGEQKPEKIFSSFSSSKNAESSSSCGSSRTSTKFS